MFLHAIEVQIQTGYFKICEHIHSLILKSKGNVILLSTDSMRNAMLSGFLSFLSGNKL